MDTTNTPVGAGNMISKTGNNMQTEVAENNPSEGRPLLDNEAKQNISRPVNDGIPSGTANDATNSQDGSRGNDVRNSTEPVPIFSQPTSAVPLSDKVADVASNEENTEPPCCDCRCGGFHCRIGDCSCFGINCGHPCCKCVLL